MMTYQQIDDFFVRQMSTWHDCRKRYDDLEAAESRVITVDGREFTLSYNPARMRSATAQVVDGRVNRPCFLCRENRPVEEAEISLTRPDGGTNTYSLSVNPFPILTHHFTIISDRHTRQTMTLERLRDMAFMAREMEGYLIFFNGAQSGASAPDHFHFQAVPQHLLALGTLDVMHGDADDVKIDFSQSDFTNILCWNTAEGLCWCVFRRLRHRPWQHSAEGAEQVLISPASIELAGIIPLARKEDYDKMTPELLSDILNQCWNREPLVDVGIGTGDMPATINDDGTTTMHNVRIGIGFHWDQTRALTYEGMMLTKHDPVSGERWIINRLPVESYLRSVISSEMSATSSLELLKAHAVISRSWLLRQSMIKKRKAVIEQHPGERIRWYDSESHTLFDVCSDDHCQRYQGISSKMNPMVTRAIEETRGEVLTFQGEICDARFSKCCGGRTEEYSFCWDNLHIPYLQAVPDTRPDGSVFCDTRDQKILSEVLNDYDLTTRDFFSWQVSYTEQQLSALIEEKLHLGLGTILALEPLSRGRSGRIWRLKIVGTSDEIIIGKELEIRKALSPTHLYSSLFDVETSIDDHGTVMFTIKGRGWGHGVGLCQIGAAVMGAEGYDYRQILAHYYKKTEIKKIW